MIRLLKRTYVITYEVAEGTREVTETVEVKARNVTRAMEYLKNLYPNAKYLIIHYIYAE